MARPTKLAPGLADLICQSLRAGVPAIYAAEGNGIDRSTYWQWLELGHVAKTCEIDGCAHSHHGPETGELSYVEFVDMVMVAEADAVRLAMSYVTKAMPKDPVNARWWLERRHPIDFGPHIKVEQPDRGLPPPIIRIVPNDRPEEELRQITGLSTQKDHENGSYGPSRDETEG